MKKLSLIAVILAAVSSFALTTFSVFSPDSSVLQGVLIGFSCQFMILAIVVAMKYGKRNGMAEGDYLGYKRGKLEAEQAAREKGKENEGLACESRPGGDCAYKIRGLYPNRDGLHIWLEDMSSRKLRYHQVIRLDSWFRDPEAVRNNGLYHRAHFKVWRVGIFTYDHRYLLVADEAADNTDENIYYDKSYVEIKKEDFDRLQAEVRAEAEVARR